jgi:hypothetical protein
MRQYIALSDLAVKPTTQRISARSFAGPFDHRQERALRQPPIQVHSLSPHEVADVRRKREPGPSRSDRAGIFDLANAE